MSVIMKFQIALSVVTALAESLVFTGVFFGYPSLQFVLEKEGYFGYLCKNNTDNTSFLTSENYTDFTQSTCGEQEANFNLIYTLGVSLLFGFSFASGYVLDKFGTWIYRTIMTTLYTLGFTLLVTSSPNSSNLIYPGLILIGVSGYGLLTSNFQVANFFKSFRGLTLSLLNGLCGSSVVVFLLVKKLYESGITLHSILQMMTCLTIVLWLRTYLLLPKKHIPFPLLSDKIEFGWKELQCYKKRCTQKDHVKSTLPKLRINSNKSEPENQIEERQKPISFAESLKNVLFWTHTFYFSIILLRSQFFPSSLLNWLRSFSKPEDISKLTDEYSFVLMFGALASALAGFMIDAIRKLLKSRTKDNAILNLEVSFVAVLITSLFLIAFSVMVLISSAYGSFVFNLLTREFVHFSNVAFVAFNFPFEHFGKLYGLINFITGLVGLLQYAIFQISLELDPTFYYINVGFLIASILTLIHPIAIYWTIRSQTLQRKTRL